MLARSIDWCYSLDGSNKDYANN